MVLNDLRGGATAYITGTTVTASAGDVTVSASAAQAMTASLESAASSSGGSKFGAGVSLAASGLIVTNTVIGGADAHITGSTLTIGGDVTVQAVNNAALEAHLVNATSSGAEAIGVTLAFNTLGWEPQNILFNTIDALIGDPAIADAFGADHASGASAYLEDTTVDATGLLTVSANSAAQLAADIANTSDSQASAWVGATGLSFGAVVGLNKSASAAIASISWTGSYAGAKTINADAGVTVTATDASGLSSTLDLTSDSSTSNTSPFSNSDSAGLAGAVMLNDLRGGATA